MRKEIPDSGSLKQYGFHQILAYLNKHQRRGMITITESNIRKDIYIEGGYIIYASSNQMEDRLGTLLVRSGKITPEQLDDSLKLSKEAGKRQGMTLVELGYLSPQDLFNQLKHQMKEMVIGLFMWEDGMFSFEENHSFPDAVKIKINIDTIIREGLIRKEKEKRGKDISFMQRVNTLFENIHAIDYYDLLGINIKTSLNEIKKAYLKTAKTYHPDSHHDVSDETKEKLSIILSYINKAYQTLGNKMKREGYDKHLLKNIPEGASGSEPNKAEEHFKRGLEECKKGNFWSASDFLRSATRISPRKATYWAHLSLALSRIPKRAKEAEEAVMKAIGLEPHNPNYYIQLGLLYIDGGMKKRAEHQFRAALNWDPTNDKARRELEKLTEKK